MNRDVSRDEIRDFFYTLTGELANYRHGDDATKLEHCYPIFNENDKLGGLAYYKPCIFGKEMGIVIRKDMQGKGNGEKCIKGICEIAKENKVDELFAKVMTANKKMIKLMEKLEWFCFENHKDYKMYKKTL